MKSYRVAFVQQLQNNQDSSTEDAGFWFVSVLLWMVRDQHLHGKGLVRPAWLQPQQ
jgi:hypothetical protein